MATGDRSDYSGDVPSSWPTIRERQQLLGFAEKDIRTLGSNTKEHICRGQTQTDRDQAWQRCKATSESEETDIRAAHGPHSCEREQRQQRMMYGSHQNLSSRGSAQHQHDPVYGAQQNTPGRRSSLQETFSTPAPIIKKINSYKIYFLQQRKKADLHAEMGQMHARLLVLSDKVQIECTMTEETPYAQALVKTWANDVQRIIDKHLEKITYKKIVIGEKSIWSQVEVSVDKENFESSALVLLKLQNEGAYVVIGTKDIVDEVSAKIREFDRTARDSNVQMQRAAQGTESSVTLKPYELILLQHLGFKKDAERTFRGLNITMNRKTKEVSFRGKQMDVEAAKTRMKERLHKVQMAEIPISQAQRSLLSNLETRDMILQKFRADSIVAVWQEVLGESELSLGVYALSDVDITRASDIIQKYVIERECQISPADSEVAQSQELHNFLQTLKAADKGKLEFTIQQPGSKIAGGKIVVTSTVDIVDKITTQLIDFLREKSHHSKSFLVPQGRLKFLREYCMKDVHAIEQDLRQHSVKITLHPSGADLEGTTEGMDAALNKLTGILHRIVYRELPLTDKFEVKFLNTAQCKAELLSLEKCHKCVLSLEPETTGGKLSHGAVAGSNPALASATSSGSKKTPFIISISIIQGHIAEQQVDILVNSAPGNLDLNSGAVSASILKAAGQGLQDEVLEKHPGKMKSGEAIYTGGHQLPCHWVCHMRLPAYGPGAEQALDTLITSCLTEANKVGFKSIAFPALGTGGLGYPADEVARTIVGTVRKFEKDVPTTSLRDVRVVIYHGDTEAYRIFQQVTRQSEVEKDARAMGSVAQWLRRLPPIPKVRRSKTGSSIGLFSSASGPDHSSAARLRHQDQGLKNILYIYAQSERDVRDVSEKFEQVTQDYIYVQRVEENPTRSITQDEKDTISRICAQCDVIASEDTSGYISIKGLKDAVLTAMTLIKDMFHEKDRRQHQETLQNIVQWCYLKPQTGDMAEHTPADNSRIEQAYRAKAPSTEITMRLDSGQQQVVVVDFNSMEQYPKTSPSDTACLIRRDKIKELAGHFRPPNNWTQTQQFRVLLGTNSPEYKEVEGHFWATLGKTVSIIKIERVQNERLWKQYTAQRDHMEKQNPGNLREMALWHGTHPAAMDRIIQYGFNRSYCGLNATMYGQGVYFALNSGYSANDTYSKPDDYGNKYMFQCKVLVGHSVKGDRNMRVLPDRLKDVPYDSATNDVNCPQMFVIFSDTQAYPEYLITFM